MLVRPDQHVAWRGSQITDPQHLLDVVTGYASPASDQKTGGPLRHFTNSRAETTPGCPAGNHLPLRRGPWARFSATRAAIWPTSLLSCLRGRRAASRQATRADGAGISHAESAISPCQRPGCPLRESLRVTQRSGAPGNSDVRRMASVRPRRSSAGSRFGSQETALTGADSTQDLLKEPDLRRLPRRNQAGEPTRLVLCRKSKIILQDHNMPLSWENVRSSRLGLSWGDVA